jgi:lipopolysaccharide/colanic/teichoic acid biosynthesis glycosyltransferase
MAIAALAIRLDSPGPAIFRQRRVGRNGVEFPMLKFRSMYHNCGESSHQAAYTRFMRGAVLNAVDASMPFKLGADPRITRVGRLLRKTSLDELPQLWNVLRGHMSLVGPRPPIPYEVALYTPHDRLRLAGPPGLTGPWQVYGRGRVPFHEMVEQDIAYLRSQSLLYDIKLLLLTIPVVLKGRGGA